MMIFRAHGAFRGLVAALLVPLMAIGGLGSPIAMAMAATDDAKAGPPVGHRNPVSGDAPFTAPPTSLGAAGQGHLAQGQRPAPDGIAMATRPVRVIVIEPDQAAPTDGASLFDGNAKTTLRSDSGTAIRIVVEFAQPLWFDGLSLFGEATGQLGLVSQDATEVIEPAAASVGGWRHYGFEHALWGQTFHFDWTPGSLELPSEWAFWQRGSQGDLSLGATPENLLPLGSFPGGVEHGAWPRMATVSRGTLGATSSASFQVDIADPRSVSRAYLVYELEGAAHFTQVKRALNDQATLGGEPTTVESGRGGLQVEEIPVSSLRAGANTVDFYPASPLVTPEYQVKNLRVVTLAAGQMLETLSFALEERGFSRKAELELGAPAVPLEISFHLQEKTQGKVTLASRAERGTTKDTFSVDLSALKPGWHTLPVRGQLRPTTLVRAALDQQVQAGALTEIVVSGLTVPQGSSSGIVLSYPLRGECFDGQAVVRGFVDGVQAPRLTVQGKSVEVLRDGSFELTASGDESQPWPLTLEAEGVDGERVALSELMQPCLASAHQSLPAGEPAEDVGAPFAQVVTAAGASLSFAGARLDIPAGTLKKPTRITIRPMPRSAVPEMNPGMTNVTPLGQAYRFGPHGLNFEGPVTLTLPYADEAVPPAASLSHISGYFYDEAEARWVQVGRAGEAASGQHASFTDHFTDFVNATIATPDAPGSAAFAQTGMNGIVAGDPLARVNFMAPPEASPFGNATTSLPIELPPGRNGMTPSLALTYDSNQAESYVGYGWRLSGLSKIELDTRFGVPDYASAFTQRPEFTMLGSQAGKLTYALDGDELVVLPSPSGTPQFRRRVEGSFEHILQLNATDGTGAKYFEVTTQDGTKYTYGKTTAAREYDPNAPSHVSAWHLESVVDVFGNGIKYTYWRIVKSLNGLSCPAVPTATPTPPPAAVPVCAYGLLPSTIEYTTHTSTPTSSYFRVSFGEGEGNFGDERVSGRAGFLTYEGGFIHYIAVDMVNQYDEQDVRAYYLYPGWGAFGKQTLEYVRQVGADGDTFAEHRFSYTKMDQLASGDGTGMEHSWVDAYAPEHVIGAYSSLSNFSLGQRNGWSFNLSVGGSVFLFSPDFLSAGFSTNLSVGETWGSHSFLDVSGDGLPDYLNAYGGALHGQYQHGNYGLNLQGTPQSGVFGLNLLGTSQPNVEVPADYDPNYDSNSILPQTWTAGVGAEAGATAVGATASGQVSLSAAMDFRTHADMDGDGLPDRVEVSGDNFTVFRNHGTADPGAGIQAHMFGEAEEWGTIIPTDLNGDPRVTSLDANDDTAQTDPLIRWVAPRSGTVRIGGAVQRTAGGSFGAQTTIYRGSSQTTTQVWSRPFTAADTSSCIPSGASGCGGSQIQTTVNIGDSLYFRLHARSGQEKSDPVQWQPTVTYTDAVGPMLTQVEPYGRLIDTFSLVNDFRIGGGLSVPVTAALKGRAALGGMLTKQQTPDNLRAIIYMVNPETNPPTRTELKKWDVSAVANPGTDLTVFTQDIPNLPGGEILPGMLLEFQLSSDAPIDPTQVTWEPYVSYYQATVPDPFPGRSDVAGAVSCFSPTVPGSPPKCQVSNGTTAVPVERPMVYRRVPVSFLQPFSVPTATRTQQFAATGGTMVLGGYLNVTAPGGYGRTVAMCQSTGRILWKDELLGTGTKTINFQIGGLTNGQLVTCSVRAEGDPNAVTLSLSADGTTRTANQRHDKALGFFPLNYDYLRVLAGQFHGWSFGDWDSSNAFAANLINQSQVAQEHPAVFPASPGKRGGQISPDDDAWQGRGGSFISETGFLQPGVIATSKALDGGEAGVGALAARISHSFTYGGDLTTPFMSVGLAESHYVQDREMIDMNGDRTADNVTAYGVSYNTGCLQGSSGSCGGKFTQNNAPMGTTATETWTKIAKTRYGLDVFKNGGKVTLVRPSRDGVPQAVSSLGIGLGSDHSSTATFRQLVDINGDGLPDKTLWNEATGRLTVELNLGYSFAPAVEWAEHARPHRWREGLYPQPLIDEGEEFADYREEIDAYMGIGSGLDQAGEPVGGVQTALAHSEVTTLTPTLGGGVTGGGGPVSVGVSGGVGYQHSIRRDLGRFVDVTGDGLLDYVVARGPIGVVTEDPITGGAAIHPTWLHVFPNLGTEFGERQMWNVPDWEGTQADDVLEYLDALNFTIAGSQFGGQDPLAALSVSRSQDLTAFEAVNICFLFVCISIASNQAMVEEQSLVEFEDVNGDGLPDFVMKERGAAATRAKLNKLGGVNLLMEIRGPAGRTTTLRYGSEGATENHPGASAVLKEVSVEDGQGNITASRYEYRRSGKVDRTERTFLGYGTVRMLRFNNSCTETTYANGDFYRKGLPTKRTVNNACLENQEVSGTLLRETYDYLPPPSDIASKHWYHPYETFRTRSLLEGGTSGPTTTESRAWDPNHGNLTSLFITGDEGAKAVTYAIDYTTPGANTVRPWRVRAIAAGVNLRDRHASYGSKGELQYVSDHDANGALLSQTQVTSRDAYGNPLTILDPNNAVTTYQYDGVTKTYVSKVTDPHGISTQLLHNNKFGVPNTIIDANGGISSYTYDQFGRVLTFRSPMDESSGTSTVYYEYAPLHAPNDSYQNDPIWVKVRHKDASRNPANTQYSAHDFIEVVTFADALGRTIQTKKDLVRDPGGFVQVGMAVSGKVLYDIEGRPWQTGQPTFSTAEATAFVIQPNALNPTLTSYDNLDRPVSVQTPLDDSPTAFLTTTTTFGHTANQSGVLKHMTSVVLSGPGVPAGKERRILRDADGEICETHEYNRIGSDTGLTQLVTRYETNPVNELERVVDSNGNQTVTLYDALGRMREMTSPDMGRVVWTYRPDGNVATKETAQLRAKGEKTTYLYTYDRLTGVNFANSNSPDIAITYGAASESGPAFGSVAGRIKSQTSEAGTKAFTYDLNGNVLGESTTFLRKGIANGASYTVDMQYKHDSLGRLLETRFLGPDRELVTYAYDQGGNLQSVFGQRLAFSPDILSTAHHTTYLAHRGYNEFGQITRELAGNFMPTDYTYASRSRRLTHLERFRGTGSVITANAYEYDSVGNIVSIDNSVGGFTEAGVQVPGMLAAFTYDNLDQLRTATSTGGIITDDFRYTLEQKYDRLGNIASKKQDSYTDDGSAGPPGVTVPGQTFNNIYTYNAAVKHAPSRVAQNGGVTTDYLYDASGNRTRSTTINETRDFTWTEDDRLRSAKRTNDAYDLVRNYYDASGEKAITLHPGTTATEETAYTANMTLRSEGNNRYTTKHIYAGSQRLASKMDARWFAPDNVQYYAADHLGSANFTFDSQQNIVSHTEYFPSGEVWRSEALPAYQGLNPYSFTGKEWDATTGLYDFGARQYDPRLGQWISPDPILADYVAGQVNGGVYWPIQLALYAYAANNPLRYRDPNGKEIWLSGKHAEELLGVLTEISGLPLIIGRFGKVEIAEGPPAANRAAGAALVQKLIASDQVVFLTGVDGKGQDRSHTAPVSVDDAVDHKPTDATVEIDMRQDTKTKFLVKGDKGTELEQASVPVKTAHELSHAESIVGGTIQNGLTTRSYVDEHGKLRQEVLKHDEIRAIHTENAVRTEHGIRERAAYIHRQTK